MLNQALRNSVAIAALAISALPAFAGPTALGPLANTGWYLDTVDAPNTASNDSPFTFTLLPGSVAIFKVTDFALTGDSLDLYVNGSAVVTLSSTAFAGAAHAVIGLDSFAADLEAAWRSDSYEKFAYTFSTPGNYSFEVRGDLAANPSFSGGLGYRLDVTSQTTTPPTPTVPEPSSLALAGLALAGLGCASRRRQKG